MTVWTVDGTSLLCELEDATISVEVDTEDAAGVCDDWKYAWSMARSWKIEQTNFVAGTGALGIQLAAGDNQVAVVLNTGGNGYTGTGLVTSGSHSIGRRALQKDVFSIEGQGPLVVDPNS